jgi:hypothetical protein
MTLPLSRATDKMSENLIDVEGNGNGVNPVFREGRNGKSLAGEQGFSVAICQEGRESALSRHGGIWMHKYSLAPIYRTRRDQDNAL